MLTNEKWFEFWKLRRDHVANITIATSMGISRQAVSKALLAIDGKIETALRTMAKANKISIGKINPQVGILFGHSVPMDTDAVIFISGKHGSWYGTNMTGIVRHARSIQNASNCSGITPMS